MTNPHVMRLAAVAVAVGMPLAAHAQAHQRQVTGSAAGYHQFMHAVRHRSANLWLRHKVSRASRIRSVVSAALRGRFREKIRQAL